MFIVLIISLKSLIRNPLKTVSITLPITLKASEFHIYRVYPNRTVLTKLSEDRANRHPIVRL